MCTALQDNHLIMTIALTFSWFLIASVPDLCILFTFKNYPYVSYEALSGEQNNCRVRYSQAYFANGFASFMY